MTDARLELWGGFECTVARLGDTYRNQIDETGHAARPDDIGRIATLGVRTVRYPVLWEAVAPEDLARCNWGWCDDRLALIRDSGMEVIAGLLHHGSGPKYTNLLDPDFPRLFADYARKVAIRYPWIKMFTPINEPLTTARFSALYGHWYPHLRDQGAFLRALVNQCEATVHAMRAVRCVTPSASLVQTEDIGRIFATRRLGYQAEYENHRRWLSFDLLSGKVDSNHPLFAELVAHVGEERLDIFRVGDCTPDVFGLNHYPTSDRYLDEDVSRYPDCFAGGNGRDDYADVEAVRTQISSDLLGVKARIIEVWERYRKPIAITEVHHGSTRDEQVRWLVEAWAAAQDMRATGADVRAVTVWSMCGAVDWNSLLVTQSGYYEPGVYDVRGEQPRPTALAAVARTLASGADFEHPVLDQPGWWRRDVRFYGRSEGATPSARPHRPVLIAGATGTLGRAFARLCRFRGVECVLLGRNDMDIAHAGSISLAIEAHKPWAVINAAGYVRVSDAAREQDLCYSSNVTGAENLAFACRNAGLRFVTFSSDLVFDGALGRPYVEGDAPCPTCVYGASKAEAEQRVAGVYPDSLVVRTSAFFGPWDRANFVWRTLVDLTRGQVVAPPGDVVSPTYVPDLVNATLDLLIDGEAGVWHLANDGFTSWREFAARAAREAHIAWTPPTDITGARPRSTPLSSKRGILLPSLDDAMRRYFQDCEVDWGRA